jgi:citrate lyase synthetase
MDMEKINDFLKKNTDNIEVRNTIKTAVEQNNNWYKILGNPLILFMLIQIVAIEKELPDDKSKIIIKFIKNLYKREKAKDFVFDEVFFHNIITLIAFNCIDKIGNTNSGFSFNSLKKILDGDVNLSDETLFSILKKGVELNILVENDSIYSFSHQLFQDTLAGDYLNSLQ